MQSHDPRPERREQARIDFNAEVQRARRWTLGAWRDVGATLTDLSARGMGIVVDQAVQRGERMSLDFALDDGGPPLRVTIEIRHVRPDDDPPTRWRAGGQFRALPPADHERIVRFVHALRR
jgi:c-di-GMP-binding flagellar brake protein YcgR